MLCDNCVQLKVREHPRFGPYVEGLSAHVVTSYDDISSWLSVGNKRRATAATSMNDTSSRSHSVFSLLLTKTTVSYLTFLTVVATLGVHYSYETGTIEPSYWSVAGKQLHISCNCTSRFCDNTVAALLYASFPGHTCSCQAGQEFTITLLFISLIR